MAKGKKPEPQLKPHKDDTDAISKIQPKEQPTEKKSEAELQNEVALDEAKSRVKVLKSSAEEIRAQIKAERAQAINNPSVIQEEIDRARINWEKILYELEQIKGLSSKRKDEIDEWKVWYEKLPTSGKQSGLERLQSEIKWRAAELEANGKKINELIPQEFEARGTFEMAKIKMEAFRAGVHQLPEDEDPRLKVVLVELDKGNAIVASLEPKRAGRK